MDLSIVTTLYRSSPYIQSFHERISACAQKLTSRYEIIFVNDGSPDPSLEKAVEIQRRDPHVVVVDLSRNFGHHRAMFTGLSYAQGALVFLIDIDLEEAPEWLPLFYEDMRRDAADLLYGIQKTRKGGLFEKTTGSLFYKIFNFLSDTPLTPNPTTARLMTARYVQSLLRHHERDLFLAGLCTITGYQQRGLAVSKNSKGSTTYALRKRLTLSVYAITAFSERPLIYIFYIGLLISFGSSLMIVKLIYLWLAHGVSVVGWSSLIVSIWFLGGLITLFLGILGIYLARIYSETKKRPYSIVRECYATPAGRQPCYAIQE